MHLIPHEVAPSYHMRINCQYERLSAGLVGLHVEVIDYDANNKCYYQPINLDEPRVLLRSGLDPDESDPQFHQQSAGGAEISPETIHPAAHHQVGHI
jgi:hypothetical protein